MTWGKRRALVISIVILFLIVLIWAASESVRLASHSVLVVDAARSWLESLMPDARTIRLPDGEQPSPDTLASKLSGLQSGAYRIPWQVLAPDGYISRGEIPFTVKNP